MKPSPGHACISMDFRSKEVKSCNTRSGGVESSWSAAIIPSSSRDQRSILAAVVVGVEVTLARD